MIVKAVKVHGERHDLKAMYCMVCCDQTNSNNGVMWHW